MVSPPSRSAPYPSTTSSRSRRSASSSSRVGARWTTPPSTRIASPARHGGEQARHGGARHQRVHGEARVVEAPRRAGHEVGRQHQQPDRRGADPREVHLALDRPPERRRVEDGARVAQRDQAEPAREQPAEDGGGRVLEDVLATERPPEGGEPLRLAGGQERGVQGARGGPRHGRRHDAPLVERQGEPGLVGGLGPAAREHEPEPEPGRPPRARLARASRQRRQQRAEQHAREDDGAQLHVAPVIGERRPLPGSSPSPGSHGSGRGRAGSCPRGRPDPAPPLPRPARARSRCAGRRRRRG